jgi:hypothetical protein
VNARFTPKETPSSDVDLIQTFIAKNGVTGPTAAQQRRYARKEQSARNLLSASDPSAYRFRPGSAAFSHRSALMSQGFTLDHKPLPLEQLTGEYAEKPAPTAPALKPAPPEPIMGYCAHCHKQLPRRVRSDRLYCPGDACRKAAARRAAKIAEANKVFKADLSIAENNRRAAELFAEYDYFAAAMNREAKRHGIEAAFLATPRGVLITEDSPGSATLAISLKLSSDLGRWDWQRDTDPRRILTEHCSRDPKVIEMIADAVIENTRGACEPEMLGGSILEREEHRQFKEDCAALVLKLNGLLSGPERKVWILTWSGCLFGYMALSMDGFWKPWPFGEPDRPV